MSIQSLGGLYGPPPVSPRIPQQEESRESVRQGRLEAPAPRTVVERPEAQQAAGTAQELPVEAPPGTDPELWSVLTGEERRYFAQARAMGPVTYGKGSLGLAELGLQRGGRLDVRV